MERNCSLVIAIFFLVHSLMFSYATVAKNITTDQDALLSLKAHDPNSLLSQNWSTASSVCAWFGVTCGVRHHRVTALNISYLGLSGTIPPQLGNLSFLRLLAISNNSFYGSLPDDLAKLRRLRYIDFKFNNFNTEIPSWFGSLSKLQYLFLRGNKFVGSIPLSLGNISLLQVLDISHNQLSASHQYDSSFGLAEACGGIISNWASQTLADLRWNEMIQDASLCQGAITKEIGNLTELKEIILRYNEFQGEIPQDLGNLPKLEVLVLSHNSLIGPIPSPIFNLSTLRIMDFTNNNVTGSLSDNMCQHLPALQGFYMSRNQLNGSIPHNLWQCRQLRYISLSVNQFEGRIPRDIGNVTFATILSLGENDLIGEIPYEIGTLRNLNILALQFNNLAGLVPANIFNISTLIELALTDSNLSGSLPSSIGQGLPNVERLFLGMNNFNGAIPSSIINASKLSIVDFGTNSFSGFIPSTIGDSLRSLEVFSVSENHLSSTPDLRFLSSLTNCKNLRILQSTGSQLDGTLPNSIGNLSVSLESFSMDNCNIRGTITEEIGKLNNLRVLRLGRNALTGLIPVTLGRLQKLQGLYLEANKLEGFIPDDLCHLNNLVDLYLGGNKLSGSIPACLGNLSTLRDLSLGSNGLTSNVPSTLSNLVGILHLNLSSNSLSGSIPSDFGNLKVLIDVDLSWNHISGYIPTANMGGLKDLKILNLSHNRLQGPIPKLFGELISLEFLDLSNNDLSGEIPRTLEALSFLKYLNLSFNRLEGEIPRGGPFANFSAKSFMGNYALCGSGLLHVSPCKTKTARKSKEIVLLLIVFPISIAITILISAVMLKRCRKKGAEPPHEANVSLQSTLRRITYQELVQATDGFNERNLLGKGSFGSVYKGMLLDGADLAVKVFHLEHEGALKSFDSECEVISSVRHRNLVKIISCCSNADFKALVLEYMPNGSLEKWLYSNNYFLDILQRLNIMIDVASALEYLHFGYSTPIVHCDLKPGNVLLDGSMVGHLSDFGIAKLLGEEESMTQTQTLATIGYMAPEYGGEGKISRRGDVYSYGIMLMETFTGKKPTYEFFSGEMNLRTWISNSLHSTIMEVIETNLIKADDKHFVAKKQCVLGILNLAMECTRESPEMRISIKEVVTRLLKIRGTLLATIQKSGCKNLSNLN